MEAKAAVEGDNVELVWLVNALEYTRARGQSESVDCLQAIADDVVFEAEMAARRASFLAGVSVK